jgi:hypothetical protein
MINMGFYVIASSVYPGKFISILLKQLLHPKMNANNVIL